MIPTCTHPAPQIARIIHSAFMFASSIRHAQIPHPEICPSEDLRSRRSERTRAQWNDLLFASNAAPPGFCHTERSRKESEAILLAQPKHPYPHPMKSHSRSLLSDSSVSTECTGEKRGPTPPSSAPSSPCATISAPSPSAAASSGHTARSPPQRIPPSPAAVPAYSPHQLPSDPDRPGTCAKSPASDQSPAASSVQSPAGTSPTHLSSTHNVPAGHLAHAPRAQSPRSPAPGSTSTHSTAPRSASPQSLPPAAPWATNTAARESAPPSG